MDEREQFTNLISCLLSTLTSALLLLQLQAVSALTIAQKQSHSFNRSISFETLSARFCKYSIELDTCLALPYNVDVFKYTWYTCFSRQCEISLAIILTWVKSHRREISLRLERVNNITSLCGDRNEFTSLRIAEVKSYV